MTIETWITSAITSLALIGLFWLFKKVMKASWKMTTFPWKAVKWLLSPSPKRLEAGSRIGKYRQGKARKEAGLDHPITVSAGTTDQLTISSKLTVSDDKILLCDPIKVDVESLIAKGYTIKDSRPPTEKWRDAKFGGKRERLEQILKRIDKAEKKVKSWAMTNGEVIEVMTPTGIVKLKWDSDEQSWKTLDGAPVCLTHSKGEIDYPEWMKDDHYRYRG